MKRLLSLAAAIAFGTALMPATALAQANSPYLAVHDRYSGGHYNAPYRHDYRPHARHGYHWQPGHWRQHGHRRGWVEGYWVRAYPGYGGPRPVYGRDARRDYDRDGIPGAYDRDRDNDGVPNRYDRDRDGDGLRNERDSRPDNPYRD